jgi:hypothetical protein
VDALLVAMEACARSPGCVEDALGAMTRLCREPSRRQRCVSAGAIEAALQALRLHESAEGVQEAGLRAAEAMARGVPAFRDRAMQAGARQAAAAALASFADVAAVAQAAQALLDTLAE